MTGGQEAECQVKVRGARPGCDIIPSVAGPVTSSHITPLLSPPDGDYKSDYDPPCLQAAQPTRGDNRKHKTVGASEE